MAYEMTLYELWLVALVFSEEMTSWEPSLVERRYAHWQGWCPTSPRRFGNLLIDEPGG